MALLRVIQKVLHSGQGGGVFTKKWQKVSRGKVMQPKNLCHYLQIYLCSFFLQLDFRSFLYHEAIITLQWTKIKHIQEAISASDIAILPHPKDYNSIILPKLSKSECANRLKLQYLTFSAAFNLIWLTWAANYRTQTSTVSCHNLSLFSEWHRG